jgi:hypothetical protein
MLALSTKFGFVFDIVQGRRSLPPNQRLAVKTWRMLPSSLHHSQRGHNARLSALYMLLGEP